MKQLIFAISAGLMLINVLIAQEESSAPMDTMTKSIIELKGKIKKMEQIELTGYVQPQYQYIDSAGAPSFAGGDFTSPDGKSNYYSRFTMRRGRIKFTYTYKNTIYVLNTDWTEKGNNIRETYMKITDPWIGVYSVTFGLLQIPFGFEITQSSAIRETPERARFNQTLFPTERDLGMFSTVVFRKSSPLNGLRITASIMNGSAAVTPEFDSHKDFLGRISYNKAISGDKISFGIGASQYYGGYTIGIVKDYQFQKINGNSGFDFAPDTANYYRVAKRIYTGTDMQITINQPIGTTTLRADYIFGEQPGTAQSSKSLSALPATAIYHRNFNAGYLYFIQNIGKSKFQTVFKYDWYDPNVKISGSEIGKTVTKTNSVDIRIDTYGFGINYYLNEYLKITAYYDYVINEKTSVSAYSSDIKDNVFTLRTQFRF